jgi:hypothetical protein
MKNTTDRLSNVMPSATPSEQEIRDWAALPREEQVRRLRATISHPDCATETSDSMEDILTEARRRDNSSRG